MRASILITPLAPLLACACLLAGCGQKGPLYLPPETPIQQATPAVTMPASQDGADETDTADETGGHASSSQAAPIPAESDDTPAREKAARSEAARSGSNATTDANGAATRKGTDE